MAEVVEFHIFHPLDDNVHERRIRGVRRPREHERRVDVDLMDLVGRIGDSERLHLESSGHYRHNSENGGEKHGGQVDVLQLKYNKRPESYMIQPVEF